VIERIFGVLKRRFRILLIGPEYHPRVQARIVASLCAIQNFIRIYDAQEGPLPDEHDPEHSNYTSHAGDTTVHQTEGAEHGVDQDVVRRRDAIAEAMWNAYQELLRKRGATTDGDNDDNDDNDIYGYIWDEEQIDGEEDGNNDEDYALSTN
jgi:hypothetical protein